MSFKLDLHVHTQSFGRTFMDEVSLRQAITANGIDGVAVVNFFNITHALWLKKQLPDQVVIVGQEIWSEDGHIIGLGLSRKIRDFLSAEQTIREIHGQGGIAVGVHPYLHMGVGGKKIHELPFDAVEGYNASIGGVWIFNYFASQLARRAGRPIVAATDTTDVRYVGYSYTEVLVDRKEDILSGIATGKVRVVTKALPIPLGFIIKNFLKFRDLEPCPLHAAPCFICGKSMIVRLFKERFVCNDCGRIDHSRIACCNEHYFCWPCMAKRIHERDDRAAGNKDFYIEEKSS